MKAGSRSDRTAQRRLAGNVEVRHATIGDAREIAEVHVIGWRTAYRGLIPDSYLANLSVDQREAGWRSALERREPAILAAIDNGRLAGWIAFARCRDEEQPSGTGEIWALYARPEHWSRGVGRTLWLAARSELIASGFHRVTLWVLAGNERACRFYRLAGFTEDNSVRMRREFGGVTLDEIRFVHVFAS